MESGRGHNLNVSLFERLVQEGMPYKALQQQHRMRPEVAAPVRALTYPSLRDGPGTTGRGSITGLQPGRVAFMVTHAWPEGADVAEGVASAESASKINVPEAEMVVASLRYMLQQGYSAADCVLLTPYLGQLRVLRRLLQEGKVDDYVDARDCEGLVKHGLADEVVRSCLSHATHSRIAAVIEVL